MPDYYLNEAGETQDDPRLDCPMCDAPNSFEIDSSDGSLGYCYKEGKWWRLMAGNYPAGVTDNDPHFSVESVNDEVFDTPYVPKGGNPWETIEQPSYPATCDRCGEVGTNKSMVNHECPHDPSCRCDQCECPF